MSARRLGIFVSGFRWSGSSALSDWLGDYDILARHPGTDSAFGEIRALNYGVQKMLLIADKQALLGERMAKWALCPDPRRWADVLGESLYRSRGRSGRLLQAIDTLFLSMVDRGLQPSVGEYRNMLEKQIGNDFLEDELYLDSVRRFMATLRHNIDRGEATMPSHEVSAAASQMFAYFYDRMVPAHSVPIFDNAIAGKHASYYQLLANQTFEKQIVYLVYRDPRDQFAELVKYSARTLRSMVDSFITEYRRDFETSRMVADQLRECASRIVHLVSFEEFVSSESLRAGLAEQLNTVLGEFGFSPNRREAGFDADLSIKNIGLWKSSGLDRQMERIGNALPDCLRAESN